MKWLTFKDTPISNNNHFKEKTLCGEEILGERRETAGERKGRLSKREERTAGELIGGHPPGALPTEQSTLSLLGPLTLEGASAPG